MRVPEFAILPTEISGRVSGLGVLRVPGAGLTALEWAAKCGNRTICEWLGTDTRTAELLQVGAPVGWACYAGQVDIARVLWRLGASPSATDIVLWRGLPPLLAAASSGKLEVLQFLVEEVRVSVHTCDDHGLGILHHIQQAPAWEQLKGHTACNEYAKARGAKKQYIRNV